MNENLQTSLNLWNSCMTTTPPVHILRSLFPHRCTHTHMGIGEKTQGKQVAILLPIRRSTGASANKDKCLHRDLDQVPEWQGHSLTRSVISKMILGGDSHWFPGWKVEGKKWRKGHQQGQRLCHTESRKVIRKGNVRYPRKMLLVCYLWAIRPISPVISRPISFPLIMFRFLLHR